MDERVVQFRVGVMVVATVIITAILTLLFGEIPSLVHGNYTVRISFTDAPGVTRDTPVRKSGIRIGRVTDVAFADDDRTVLVTAEIDGKYRLYHNEVCRSFNSMLTGDASLDFVRSRNAKADVTLIENGEVLEGQVAEDPSRALVDIQQGMSHTMGSVDDASQKMTSVLGRLDSLLGTNEDKITELVRQADKTLKSLDETLGSANDVLGDPKVRQQLKEAVGQLPEVLRGTRDTVDRMGRSVSLLEDNLRNVEGITRPLGERGEALVGRVDASTIKLKEVMDRMALFTEKLNDPQGSLGRLINDPEMYQHISRAAKNIDELTRDLKPIMCDIRVFTDKIARHPESLGVRGAIQKNPGLK